MAAVRFLQWNARSLNNKFEFKQHVSVYNYDVICIQETWLKENKSYNLSGYDMVRYDRPLREHGGVATFVRSGLKYAQIKINSDLECVVLKLETSSGHINVVNVYIPPDKTFNTDQNQLKEIFSFSNCIIMGDFNAKNPLWGSSNTDKLGDTIENLIDENQLCVLNTGLPTYQCYQGGMTHLDITVVSNNLACKCNWSTLNNSMSSDHIPIVTVLNDVLPDNTSLYPKWKLNKSDWDSFYGENRVSFSTFDLTENDVNLLNSKIVKNINSAASVSIPKTKSNPGKRKKALPYWNDRIKESIKLRNIARNKMNKTKDIDDCIEYRRRKGVAQKIIKDESRTYWQNFCGTLNNQTKMSTVWSMAKKMNGIQTNKKPTNIILNNKKLETDQEIAEAFADEYAGVSSNQNYDQNFLKHKMDVESNLSQHLSLSAPEPDPELNVPFSNFELTNAISSLKRNSSPGQDDVLYEFIKHLPKNGHEAILHLFNTVWSSGILPDDWHHSIVIPILKAGKPPEILGSYRPISLTSTLCKLMERMVTSRLVWYLEKHNLLNNSQCGFRKNRSTLQHIIRLQDNITKYNHNSGYTLSVFLDFEKAFDMLWRKGLHIKLHNKGIRGNILNFINNFLTNRTLEVRIGNAKSTKKVLENGTAQGSVISPVLFLIMIDDLPRELVDVESALFADDSSIFKSGKNIKIITKTIQNALDETCKWCEKWGFKISIQKTYAVLFTQCIGTKIELKIDGKSLQFKTSAKFLGVILDSKLTWHEHINYILSKCNKRLNFMRSISGNTWGACKTTMITIYKALILSVIDYGCIAYDSASDSQLLLLDRLQNKALRIACGSFKTTPIDSLQVDCGIQPLHLHRLEKQLKLAVNIKSTENHVCKAVIEDHWTLHYGNFTFNSKPLYLKTNQHLDNLSITASSASLGDVPPWLYKAIKIDKRLHNEVSKHESPIILKSLAIENIQTYSDSIHVYTDASKLSNGNVGVGIFFPHLQISVSERVSNNVSIFAGELTAIKRSIELFQQNSISKNQTLSIFSDSLSVIQSLDSIKTCCRPNLVTSVFELITKVNFKIIVIWVPSHIGIPGNEEADKLALAGASLPLIQNNINFELSDANILIQNYVQHCWQSEWSESKSVYRTIEENVSNKIKFTNKSRKKEVILTRLRLGKCKLNSYLHQIKLHPSGLCATCNQPETIEHHLLNCENNISKHLSEMCRSLKVTPSLQTVLKNEKLLDCISKLIDRSL